MKIKGYRFWEEYFAYLAKGLKPVRPPARVWEIIQRRLLLTTPRDKMRH